MSTHGHYEPAFATLADTFSRRTEASEGGGALAVYVDGEKVVDVWGGVRDPSGAPWEEGTPSLSFSTTKGIASLALHRCADRGLIDYDAPVARYWPEFAQAGKERTTVRHVLCHEAGLYNVRELLGDAHELLDWDTVVSKLAAARPAHAPGRFNAYHALTYGYLVGELVHRVSGAHLRDFVRTELAEPLGLDHLHIGAPAEAVAQAARYFPLPEAEAKRRAGRNAAAGVGRPPKSAPSGKKALGARLQRGSFAALQRVGIPMNPRRFASALAPRGVGKFDWSSDATLAACNPSAGGLFSARAGQGLRGARARGGDRRRPSALPRHAQGADRDPKPTPRWRAPLADALAPRVS
jgi:CubicO group peptidase (beta-lactamase class C family)